MRLQKLVRKREELMRLGIFKVAFVDPGGSGESMPPSSICMQAVHAEEGKQDHKSTCGANVCDVGLWTPLENVGRRIGAE